MASSSIVTISTELPWLDRWWDNLLGGQNSTTLSVWEFHLVHVVKVVGLSSAPWSQLQQYKVGGRCKGICPACCKTCTLLTSFYFLSCWMMLQSPWSPAGSPSWWAYDTFNNQNLFPCGWVDRGTDRIYLQGRNCSETVTAALRNWCEEVLGFHIFPRVCRGRISLLQCRMRVGQRNWVRCKPSISIFHLFFQEASPLSWGLLLQGI